MRCSIQQLTQSLQMSHLIHCFCQRYCCNYLVSTLEIEAQRWTFLLLPDPLLEPVLLPLLALELDFPPPFPYTRGGRLPKSKPNSRIATPGILMRAVTEMVATRDQAASANDGHTARCRHLASLYLSVYCVGASAANLIPVFLKV